MDWEVEARTLLSAGAELDTLAKTLLEAGAGPIATVKAMRSAAGVDLGEAKRIVDAALPPEERASNERLRDFIHRLVEREEN